MDVAPKFSGAKQAAQARIVGAISGRFAETLDHYQISTYLRIAHFMGQVTHECAGFRTTEEFASGAGYNGRADLGNTQPGDGPRYKGRGLLQLTGRFNYRRMGPKLGLDLEGNPVLAGDPLTSLHTACEYWSGHKINALCDADDLERVTRAVNGGLNGLDDRRFYLGRAKTALKARMGTIMAHAEGGAAPVLRRGSKGDVVAEVQRLLHAKGFQIAIDQDFGPATELAVVQFQRKAKLEPDGIVGRMTWAALRG
jgi:putative chitinase